MQEQSEKANSEEAKSLYESGAYFSEAASWYESIYLSSVVTRNLYILIVLTLIYAFSIISILLNNFFPMQTTIKLVAQKNVEEDEKMTITKISGYKNPILSIAQLLIKNYVINREEYIHPGLRALGYIDQKVQVVKNLSSRNVFADFEQSLSSASQGSMMYNFRNNKTRNITINSIQFENQKSSIGKMLHLLYKGKAPNTAEIIFTSQIDGITTKYLVYMVFDIKIPPKPQNAALKSGQTTNLSKIKSYFTGLEIKYNPNIDFTVLKYDVKQIK